MQELTRSDTFNITQLAYFLDRLSQSMDGEAPLIDSTMTTGSGLSYGTATEPDQPALLWLEKGLGLKHGSHIDFNRRIDSFEGYQDGIRHYHKPVNDKAHGNLLLTMGQRMGLEAESFADSNGVVSEVLLS